MLYQAYQAHSDIMVPVRAWAGAAIQAFGPINGFAGPGVKNLTAAYELIARSGLTHVRPPYGIHSVLVDPRDAVGAGGPLGGHGGVAAGAAHGGGVRHGRRLERHGGRGVGELTEGRALPGEGRGCRGRQKQ